ncbi:MAG: hypothetical protein WAN22_08290 [Solirubrobacteraceae bacterium]
MVKLSNFRVIINPGGVPTADKPDTSLVDYTFDNVSTYPESARSGCFARAVMGGAQRAEFATPVIDRGAEIRCWMCARDGYLIEVRQSTGLLEASLAKKRPEDLPG